MKIYKTLIAAFFLLSSTVFAHGEHKPGPHGGEIRMPGAFHTEVVAETNNVLKVYLLDMKFQSPMTEDSSVQVTFIGNQSHEASCKKQTVYFSCEFDVSVLNKEGQLHVTATRNKRKGGMVHYATPLK